MKMAEITYKQVGDYLIPDIELDDAPREPLSKYGLIRLRHLQQNDKVYYTMLQIEGCLYSHLEEIQESANRQVEQFIESMLKKEPVPDRNADPLGWVGHMENLKARAEEVVTRGLIFE